MPIFESGLNRLHFLKKGHLKKYAEIRCSTEKSSDEQNFERFLKTFKMRVAKFNLVEFLQSYSHLKMRIISKIAFFNIF